MLAGEVGLDGPGAGDGYAIFHEARGLAALFIGYEVEDAELVVGAPAAPVGAGLGVG